MVNNSQQNNDTLNIKTLLAQIKIQKQSAQADLRNVNIINTLVSKENVKPIKVYGNSDSNNKPGPSSVSISDKDSSPQNQSSIKGYFNVVKHATDPPVSYDVKDILKLLQNNKNRSSPRLLDRQTPCSTKELTNNPLISIDAKECLKEDFKKRKPCYSELESCKRKKLFNNNNKRSQIVNYFCRTDSNTSNEKIKTNHSNTVGHLEDENLINKLDPKIKCSNKKNNSKCDIGVNGETENKKNDIIKFNSIEKKKTTSFNDLFNNIIKKIDNKPSIPVENIVNASVHTPHLSRKNISKSCSASVLQTNPKPQVELNSVPITNHEIQFTMEKLQKRNSDFNQLVQNLIKKINDIKSDSEQTVINSSDLLYNIGQGNNLQQSINSKEIQLVENKSQPQSQPIEKQKAPPERNKEEKHKVFKNRHNIVSSVEKQNKIKEVDFKALENNSFFKRKVNQNVTKNENSTFVIKSIENNPCMDKTDDEESEDFLSYFPRCFSNNLNAIPSDNTKEIDNEDRTDVSNKDKHFITTDIQNPSPNPYNQIPEEYVSQDLSHILPVLDLNNLLDNNVSEFQIIENTKANSEVSTTKSYETPIDRKQFEENPVTTVTDDMFKTDEQIIKESPLEHFFRKVIKDTKQSFPKFNKCLKKIEKKDTHVRRYRKGKVKIYKIKRLKKPKLKSLPKPKVEENLNFEDVFNKLTQDIVETESTLQRSKTMSSISTSSSYITDHTQSDVLSNGSTELTESQQRLRKGINELLKDKSLLCPNRSWEEPSEENKEQLKLKIQDIFLKVGKDLVEKQCSMLKFPRHDFKNCIFRDGRLQLRPIEESSMTVINSNNTRSQIRFKLILYIMKKIMVLLETDTKLTKRELYYQLKTLVNDQRVIDRIISTISSLLNVGSWALNIIAQKGLVFGNLKILLSTGETLNCNIRGTLIPQDVSEIVEIHSVAYFILVVEKESIFYKLIDEGLPERLTRPFIMITGKGFPDLNTQLFLKKLWTIMSVPVFILVDADPHGINIMLNYRFGSVNNAHVSHHLAVPNAKWLGIYPSEIVNLNLVSEPLNDKELRLVDHLLKTPYVESNNRLVDELKVLQEKKCKAEIEGLIKSHTFLTDVYMSSKFFTHNFI